MKLILTRSFEMAEERLDRANHLVRVLRSNDNKKRVSELTLYLAKSIGRREPEGLRLHNLGDHIFFHIDMPREEITKELTELCARGLLKHKSDDEYTVPSLENLAAATQTPIPQEESKFRGMGG